MEQPVTISLALAATILVATVPVFVTVFYLLPLASDFISMAIALAPLVADMRLHHGSAEDRSNGSVDGGVFHCWIQHRQCHELRYRSPFLILRSQFCLVSAWPSFSSPQFFQKHRHSPCVFFASSFAFASAAFPRHGKVRFRRLLIRFAIRPRIPLFASKTNRLQRGSVTQ